MSDEGFGDVIVYVRISGKKLGAVESTLVADFRRLLIDDFQLIGRGPAAIRYVRSIFGRDNKVPRIKRGRGEYMRQKCREYTVRCRDVKFVYRTEDICINYNGCGLKGTGGPKLEWLRPAVDAFIEQKHPTLHTTKVCVRDCSCVCTVCVLHFTCLCVSMMQVMRVFKELGYELIFTVPYWAKSQPAELAWAYDKNYAAHEYHPGRTMKQLRLHIKRGFYGGPKRDGGVHGGIDECLARKFIMHTHKFINEYISESPKLKDTGIECVLR